MNCIRWLVVVVEVVGGGDDVILRNSHNIFQKKVQKKCPKRLDLASIRPFL